MNLFQRLAVRAIDRYQAKGGGREIFRVDCNFEPSCSEYTKQAVKRFGVFRGGKFAISRLRRCRDSDCVSPAHDPVPARTSVHV